MPSAATIENEGLTVGEMQLMQMKKIEELTLYIIELNKKETANKAEIALLRKQIEKKRDK